MPPLLEPTHPSVSTSLNCLTLSLLLITPCAALSMKGTEAKKTSQTKEAENREKLVCKREKVLGSNRTQKVCKTQSQIDAEKASAQRFGQQIRNATGVKSTLGQ